jgi:uncharacterized damage-inducible protein DinB
MDEILSNRQRCLLKSEDIDFNLRLYSAAARARRSAIRSLPTEPPAIEEIDSLLQERYKLNEKLFNSKRGESLEEFDKWNDLAFFNTLTEMRPDMLASSELYSTNLSEGQQTIHRNRVFEEMEHEELMEIQSRIRRRRTKYQRRNEEVKEDKERRDEIDEKLRELGAPDQFFEDDYLEILDTASPSLD